MTSNANLDRLNEIAATIGSRVATLHETAEHYPDSRVTSVFRDRITNTLYSHVENAMQQATAEINRLKTDFEVELRASQAATKELQDQRQAADLELDELAMAREALAEKEKAIVEERNEIARQRLVLLHDQEQFKIERRKHERSVNAERTQLSATEKALTVRETQLQVRADAVNSMLPRRKKPSRIVRTESMLVSVRQPPLESPNSSTRLSRRLERLVRSPSKSCPPNKRTAANSSERLVNSPSKSCPPNKRTARNVLRRSVNSPSNI